MMLETKAVNTINKVKETDNLIMEITFYDFNRESSEYQEYNLEIIENEMDLDIDSIPQSLDNLVEEFGNFEGPIDYTGLGVNFAYRIELASLNYEDEANEISTKVVREHTKGFLEDKVKWRNDIEMARHLRENGVESKTTLYLEDAEVDVIYSYEDVNLEEAGRMSNRFNSIVLSIVNRKDELNDDLFESFLNEGASSINVKIREMDGKVIEREYH